MAERARIPVEVFERGQCPNVCFLTGERTTDRMSLDVSSASGGGIWLLLGVVPWMLVRSLTSKSAEGWLPITEESYKVVSEMQRKARIGRWVAAISIVAMVLELLRVIPGVLAFPSLLALIGGVILNAYWQAINPAKSVSLEKSGRWVSIPRASEEFVRALDNQLRST